MAKKKANGSNAIDDTKDWNDWHDLIKKKFGHPPRKISIKEFCLVNDKKSKFKKADIISCESNLMYRKVKTESIGHFAQIVVSKKGKACEIIHISIQSLLAMVVDLKDSKPVKLTIPL